MGKENDNRFYVYALLDPRKPGKYDYGDICFFYEPFYIGKGTGNRIRHHTLPSSLSKNNFKNSVIKKIMSNNLTYKVVKIIDLILPETAYQLEEKFISLIGRRNKNKGPLTNLDDGGRGVIGYSHTEETKRKISKNSSKNQLGKKLTDEVKRKISETKKRKYASGEIIHPMLGKKQSKESIEKGRLSRIGLKWTDKQKNNLKKIRCQKKNKSQTKYWKVIFPEGKEQIVYGLGEFCRNNNLQQGHMFSVAKGDRKHHKGWKCEYYTNPEDLQKTSSEQP